MPHRNPRQHSVPAVVLAAAFLGFAGCHPGHDVEIAIFPAFVVDSAIAGGTSAIVGTISDSASGRALVGGAQFRVTLRGDSAIRYSLTDKKGGFIIPRLAPGNYSYLVRAIGYMSARGELRLQASRVDTLRFRLARSPFGGEWTP